MCCKVNKSTDRQSTVHFFKGQELISSVDGRTSEIIKKRPRKMCGPFFDSHIFEFLPTRLAYWAKKRPDLYRVFFIIQV